METQRPKLHRREDAAKGGAALGVLPTQNCELGSGERPRVSTNGWGITEWKARGVHLRPDSEQRGVFPWAGAGGGMSGSEKPGKTPAPRGNRSLCIQKA